MPLPRNLITSGPCDAQTKRVLIERQIEEDEEPPADLMAAFRKAANDEAPSTIAEGEFNIQWALLYAFVLNEANLRRCADPSTSKAH